jgi:hypothetical protein
MRSSDVRRVRSSPIPAVPWPPSVGDYVRVRRDQVLGEVIEIPGRGKQRRYVVLPFTRRVEMSVAYRLDELESAWPAEL